ncbi:tetratricopeptide repeat protein [Azospira inquinata]|uniref:Tetratricopeptide repeat protein n=1 Tax=Azospira inquinata TaxID=2785627 RepID=A0A975SNQ1_9RHOO|nr:tetratricopeptide repeat protein [Azospira inquinata]QWT45482.1 tetratricopeptide repeat protein [Azospira inquinata]QWT49190.1 tetratricopeptide repeat protein [Azospira inquinata]
MSAPTTPHLYRQALDHHKAGRLEDALALYQRLLAENPADGEWLAQAGLAACQAGQTAQGCAWLERAVKLAPDQIGVWLNLATVRYALGQGAASLAAADQALARLPGTGAERATALGARGRALIALGRLDAALAAYEQAATLEPGQPDYARAVALLQVQRQGPEAALPALERALALVPEDPVLQQYRGLALLDGDQPEAALAAFRRIEQASANGASTPPADALLGQGLALAALGQTDPARACCDRVLAAQPHHPGALNNRGLLSQRAEDYPAALADFREAVAHHPQFAEAWFNLALLELRLGDYEAGWAHYEWRWRRRPAPVLPGRPWRGDFSLAGKTLVLYAEQGYGDTLQFCRYLPQVVALGARVILRVPGPLVPLLRSLPGAPLVQGDDAPPPPGDAHCPLLSLPLALGRTRPEGGAPYLAPDPELSRSWAARLATSEKTGAERPLRIGLVWAGGERPQQPEARSINRRRNVPLALLAPLAQVPSPRPLHFISLQKGEAALAQLAQLDEASWPAPRPEDFSAFLTDFAQSAALVAQLDLVITVDTAVAHLAGALGRPVWIFNRRDHCWRWGEGEGPSPWYPTARLFRQSAPGDWPGVVARVATALEQWSRDQA